MDISIIEASEEVYADRESFADDERQQIEINLLLEGIYQMYGYDFRGYVRSSLRRRILNRMKAERLPTITALLEKVLHEEGVLERLLNDLSIRMTEMFRDPSFFAAFRKQVVPLLRGLPEIRIWHAGCATGEEVYSMAILMHEEGLDEKTRIYGTDMNEKAIAAAKKGAFALKQMQQYTKNYLEAGGSKAFSEYYTTDHQYAYFHPDLGENMMFAQHNLVTDGSFNEFHVILCRNVLIYFDQDLQQHVHRLMHNSLSDGGFLGLGSKESILFAPDRVYYEDFIPQEKVYRKQAVQK
ncbi:protein-glutamate O-methyltransferase CheR [Brevibacillus centrosporus]|uniref:CheR family methyltransferase n=1 Tax=Brevibacillus centrosporus TaxID=54910 RepID=UPI000F09F185|nr:protein-glutamate O-methyltransferase CheR [Brevibacillus centrosporus]MEC2133246.1 protein-glutamate O-methyltransferase CheR [Brevibacillus centrosporus]MED4910998.1 protein-glutamate O-methyltransferase CheR [Brevibacillus centrosporus]RNB64985.1 protein-glutamate O-methyltransferase CheR [Brevibacillus centrosporus]